jgi:iron complex transport system ATP-binding protein
VVHLEHVSVVRNGTAILDDVSWAVGAGERWALLGPNGSGKTTLLKVIGSSLWPSRGVVEILGERLGRVDMRELRKRIAVVSASVARTLRQELPALDVVLTGRHAALETWWNQYTDEDRELARSLLAESGLSGADFAARPFGLLSEGERQQVLLARALMGRPELLLMDEPAAGLDLGARERLLARLAALAGDPAVPPLVLVTHHLEEIPPGVTHAALMREARMLVAGPVAGVLTGEGVSAAFGVEVAVDQHEGRWTARAEQAPHSAPGRDRRSSGERLLGEHPAPTRGAEVVGYTEPRRSGLVGGGWRPRKGPGQGRDT